MAGGGVEPFRQTQTKIKRHLGPKTEVKSKEGDRTKYLHLARRR